MKQKVGAPFLSSAAHTRCQYRCGSKVPREPAHQIGSFLPFDPVSRLCVRSATEQGKVKTFLLKYRLLLAAQESLMGRFTFNKLGFIDSKFEAAVIAHRNVPCLQTLGLRRLSMPNRQT